VRREQGAAAVEHSQAGFYYADSATTRHLVLALPRNGARVHARARVRACVRLCLC
jgi:hypothetical protein